MANNNVIKGEKNMTIEKAIESIKINHIKQCPLCGHNRISFEFDEEDKTFTIQCPCCHILMKDSLLTNVRSRWNKRGNYHMYNKDADVIITSYHILDIYI